MAVDTVGNALIWDDEGMHYSLFRSGRYAFLGETEPAFLGYSYHLFRRGGQMVEIKPADCPRLYCSERAAVRSLRAGGFDAEYRKLGRNSGAELLTISIWG